MYSTYSATIFFPGPPGGDAFSPACQTFEEPFLSSHRTFGMTKAGSFYAFVRGVVTS